MARTALVVLSTFALACVVAAGIAGLNHGERKFEKPKLTTTFVPRPGEAGPTTSTSSTSTTSTTSPS